MKNSYAVVIFNLFILLSCFAHASDFSGATLYDSGLYDPTTPLAGGSKPHADHPLLELSSIGGGIDHDYFAVINGMYVKEGDSVFDVNIIEIEAKAVLYRYQNKMYTLILKP